MVTISSRDGGPVDEDGYQWPKGVGRPAIAALRQAGITTLEALAGRSEREIASLHGMGPKSLRILKEVMAQSGMQPLS